MLRTDTVPTVAKTGSFRMFAKHTFVSTMHLAGTIMMKLRKLLIVFNCTVKVSIYDAIIPSIQQRAYKRATNTRIVYLRLNHVLLALSISKTRPYINNKADHFLTTFSNIFK